MNIVCIGGGPASLYFSALAKKAHPARAAEIDRELAAMGVRTSRDHYRLKNKLADLLGGS